MTHHRTVQAAGRTVFYREAGDQGRPTIVLLHGAPSSSFMFRDLIPKLAQTHHVLAPDLIGFGQSDAPTVAEWEYTFDHLAEVTEAFLQAKGIERFAIYVQDYGAPIGWRLLLNDATRITGIVTQNGNAYEEGFVDSFWAGLWKYAADQTPENAAPLRAVLSVEDIKWQYTHGVPDPTLIAPDAWLHDAAQVAGPDQAEIQLALFADYPSNVKLYPAVQEAFRASQVPLLAVWGKNDEIFGPAGAKAFARDLPDAEIELLDGGHFLLESHATEVAALMLEFLAKQ